MKNQIKKSKRNLSGLTLISLLLAIIIFSCKKNENTVYKTYTLDVSNITSTESGQPLTGTFIVSHNAIAVFPLNLSIEYDALKEIGPSTIIEVQTKSGCTGGGRTSLSDNHEIVRNINSFGPVQINDIGHIRKIILEMPYNAVQDTFTRLPGTLCFGFYIKNKGWFWNFTSIVPALDNNLNAGSAEVTVDEKDVEIVGILFDRTTSINKIIFEAKKVK